MKYGTEAEPHAIATLVNNILPMNDEFAGLQYREEGGLFMKYILDLKQVTVVVIRCAHINHRTEHV